MSDLDKLFEKCPVLLISMTGCPACVKIENQFDKSKINQCKFKVDKESNGMEIQNKVAKISRSKQVPQTFVKGNQISYENVIKQGDQGGFENQKQ